MLHARERRRNRVRENALASARRAGASLRERFSFQDLYVVGSVLGRRFRLTSDLDLVVVGLDMRDFHRAHAYLMQEIGGPLEIDLKAFEDLPEAMQRCVREQGVRIT